MAKSDVTVESAMLVVDRLAKELGLLVGSTSACHKVEGPVNKHRIYIFKAKALGRIDFTMSLDATDPAFAEAVGDNGAIRCKIKPDLVQLERCLRMLGDATAVTQVSNKPKPFAATKNAGPRTPKPTAKPTQIEVEEVPEPVGDDGQTLLQRLGKISDRLRAAKVNRLIDEHGLTQDEAEAVLDKRLDLEDVLATHQAADHSDVMQFTHEAGIEVLS